MSDNVSSCSTSKKDLNRPLYETLKAGVTAMTASAPATVSNTASKAGAGQACAVTSFEWVGIVASCRAATTWGSN
jgi:hypothetical protein